MYLVISTSLNPDSSSRQIATRASDLLGELSVSAQTLDLASYALPMHGRSSSRNPEVQEAISKIAAATGIVIVLPIYHGDVAVSARNLIQLAGKAWQRKVIGLACVAGDGMSHFAAVGVGNLLMLEHRSFVIPDFVFAESGNLSESLLTANSKLDQQMRKLTENLIRVTESLKHA